MKEVENAVNREEISLKDLLIKIREWWQYLWKKKWFIIVAGVIGGILGLTYSLIKKPIYTATTTFVLENGEKGGGLAGYAGIASMMGLDLGVGGGGIFQGDNIIELYKSRTMIEKTLLAPIDSISKKTLVDRYLEVTGAKSKWDEKPELKDIKFTPLEMQHPNRLRDSIMTSVIRNITGSCLSVGKPDRKLSIIKVVVRSGDEIFSRRFNEELVKHVNDFYIQTKTKKSLENVSILQHKTDSVRAVMNGAIYTAVEVSDATPNLNPTRQVKRVAPLQKAQFSAETNKAVLSEMMKNLEMSKMALMKEAPLIQVIDLPVYPLDKERLGKAKGIIMGGFSVGFLTVIYLLFRKFLKNILSE
ncbi:Chain length determinant protein [compost metagenome]